MYTPQLLQSYKSSKSNLPLSTWVNIIGKNLPQFKNEENIFNPVPIPVRLAEGSNGSVLISVAPSNQDWYKTVTGALEKMTGRRNISIVNYVGEPIKYMSMAKLAHVGECNVIDTTTGKSVRLPKIVPPPLELSTNKVAQLKDWWNSNREELSASIASNLKGLNMAEIAKATSPNGSVFKTINNYISNHTIKNLEWSEFTRTFGKSVDSEHLAEFILGAVKNSLTANEKQIRNYHATEGIEASLWKKVTTGKNKYKDDFTMYQDIVDDAIFHTMVGQKVIQSIVYGVEKKTTPLKRVTKEAAFHPVDTYYKEHHYPVHGKLPGHVIESYNKTFGKVETKYTGNPEKAIQMFNLYVGNSVIGCKNKKKKMPGLIPVESQIGNQFGSHLPELVPIGGDSQFESHRLPELVPIGSSATHFELPELVPIGSQQSYGGRGRLPELVPIGSQFDSHHMEIADEPSLADFL